MEPGVYKYFLDSTFKQILLVIFIFNVLSLNAQQQKIDSLKNLISNAKKDTANIGLYEKLGDAYRSEKKMDSCILSFRNALEINKKTNYSLQRQCWNMAALDYILYETGNYTESLKYASGLLVLSEKLNDTGGLAMVNLVFGLDYKEMGYYRHALNHYFKAYPLWDMYHKGRHEPEDNIYTMCCIAEVYLKMKTLDSAFMYAHRAFKIAGTVSNGGYILLSTRILGDIYFAQGNDETALHYYRQYIPDFVKYKGNNRDLGFVLNNMAKIFQKRSQKDSAILYAKKALNNAKEYQDQENIYNASNLLYKIYDDKNQRNVYTASKIEDITQDNQAILRIKTNSLKNLISASKTDTAKIDLYEKLGQAYRNEKKIDSSVLSYKQALEINEKANYSLQKQCLDIAVIDYLLYTSGNYIESLKYATRKLALSKSLKDTFQIGFSYATFGHNYKALGDYRLALNNYFKARKIFSQYFQVRNIPENDPYIIQCIGDVYLKLHLLDSALMFTRLSIVEAGSIKPDPDPGNKLNSARTLGDIYLEKTDYQRALAYYRAFITGFIKYNNPPFVQYKQNSRDLGFVYHSISGIFEKAGQKDSAIFYAKKAFDNAKQYHDLQNIYAAAYLLYKLNDTLNDQSQAFTYFKIAETAKDSMAGIEKIRQIQTLTFNEQTRERVLAEVDAKEAGRRKLIITIAAIIVVIISFLVWNRIRQLRLKHKMILEQKEAEKLRAIDKMKDKFFTNITHELRTPLSLIMSPAEFYLQHPEELTDTPKFLESLFRNSGYLLNLINQLLDISRLDAGKMNSSLSKDNFGNYIGDLVKTFDEQAAKKQIGLHFENDLTGEYVFDAEQWKKIISNLLGNAIKFTLSHGNVFVSINKISVTAEATAIRLSVRDTGIGINKDQLPFITDRFYQADNNLTRKYEGTGIGLSLVNELVKLMNAGFEIDSEEGKGSTFVISASLLSAQEKEDFPALPALATSIQYSDIWKDTKKVSKNIKGNAPVILVTEDNPDLNKFLKDSLANLYHVITAPNGAEGFEMAVSHAPDIIISDIMMPVMDGFEFCDKIKNSAGTSHIPFIILSAKTTYENRMAGLQKGADDYLTKPFSVDELLSKIKNILSRQQQLKATYENELLKLEARALRAQMNPHFIFNCMNSIKSLILQKDEDRAINYLTTFSKLIRTIFQNSDKREINLFDEIETARLYTQLESMRFDHKFSCSFFIDDTIDLKSLLVPALILQPFIENAIWHGIVPKQDDGNITVTVEQTENGIYCIIDDNGIGRESSMQNKFKGDATVHQSKGVHLTQSRLDLDNLINERNTSLKIVDKKDDQGKATGTTVILTFKAY